MERVRQLFYSEHLPHVQDPKNMANPPKRRRLSRTRSIGISPVKVPAIISTTSHSRGSKSPDPEQHSERPLTPPTVIQRISALPRTPPPHSEAPLLQAKSPVLRPEAPHEQRTPAGEGTPPRAKTPQRSSLPSSVVSPTRASLARLNPNVFAHSDGIGGAKTPQQQGSPNRLNPTALRKSEEDLGPGGVEMESNWNKRKSLSLTRPQEDPRKDPLKGANDGLGEAERASPRREQERLTDVAILEEAARSLDGSTSAVEQAMIERSGQESDGVTKEKETVLVPSSALPTPAEMTGTVSDLVAIETEIGRQRERSRSTQEQDFSLMSTVPESTQGASQTNVMSFVSAQTVCSEASNSTPTSQLNAGPEPRHDEDGDPELPATPSELGLEPRPEPPKGLLFSSPPKKGERRRRGVHRSSPLKPKEKPRKGQSHSQAPAHIDPKGAGHPRQQRLVSVENKVWTLSDFTVHDAAREEEERELERLLTQQKRLEAETGNLNFAAPNANGSTDLPAGQADDDVLLSLLLPPSSSYLSETRPVSLADRLALFLPFGNSFRPSHPKHPSRAHCSPDASVSKLTPLRISTGLRILTDSDSGALYDLIEKRTILIISPEPTTLLCVELSVTAKVHDDSIRNIELVNRSQWAYELGMFIGRQAGSPDPTRTDLASIARACTAYWGAACERGAAWDDLRADAVYGRLMFDGDELAREGNEDVREDSARALGQEDHDNDEEDKERGEDASERARRIAADCGSTELATKSLMTFSQGPVSVVVSWDIRLDGTGTARSETTAWAARADNVTGAMVAFDEVRQLFQLLERRDGTLEALKFVLASVFGDSDDEAGHGEAAPEQIILDGGGHEAEAA